jgi:O-antigen/teichoic acid export membrane protein
MLSRTDRLGMLDPRPQRHVPRMRLFRNFGLLATGEALSKGLTIAAYAYLARALGPEEFGTLEFALAVIAVLVLLLDCGLGSYAACEVGRDPTTIPALIRPVVTLRLALMLIACIMLGSLVVLLDQRWSLRRILLLYGLALLPLPASLSWVFQGTDAMNVVAVGSMLRWVVFAAGVGLFVSGPHDTVVVPIVETTALASMVLFYLAAFRRRFPWAPAAVRTPGITTVFREALPIGASDFAWALRMYSPTMLLGIFAGGAGVGWFGGAHRIVLALHTFVWLYFFNVLPSLARTSAQPLAELRTFLQASLRLTAWAVVFLGVVVSALSEPIVTTLYGPAFQPAASALPVLIWLVPLAAMSGHYRYVLIGHGKQRRELAASASGAIVSIALGVSMAGSFGMLGMAVALVASEGVIWALAYAFVRQTVMSIPVATVLWKPLLSGVGLTAALALTPREMLWSMTTAAGVGYWCCAVLAEPQWRHSVLTRLRSPSAAESEIL